MSNYLSFPQVAGTVDKTTDHGSVVLVEMAGVVSNSVFFT